MSKRKSIILLLAVGIILTFLSIDLSSCKSPLVWLKNIALYQWFIAITILVISALVNRKKIKPIDITLQNLLKLQGSGIYNIIGFLFLLNVLNLFHNATTSFNLPLITTIISNICSFLIWFNAFNPNKFVASTVHAEPKEYLFIALPGLNRHSLLDNFIKFLKEEAKGFDTHDKRFNKDTENLKGLNWIIHFSSIFFHKNKLKKVFLLTSIDQSDKFFNDFEKCFKVFTECLKIEPELVQIPSLNFNDADDIIKKVNNTLAKFKIPNDNVSVNVTSGTSVVTAALTIIGSHSERQVELIPQNMPTIEIISLKLKLEHIKSAIGEEA